MYLLYANLSLACLFSLAACKLEFHLKSNYVFQIEKNFFLQGSMSKTMHSTDGKRKENRAMTTEEKSRAQSGNVSHAAGCAENNIETAKSKASTSIVSSASGSSGRPEASVKLKSSRDVKKPPRGSTFFDRYYLVLEIIFVFIPDCHCY